MAGLVPSVIAAVIDILDMNYILVTNCPTCFILMMKLSVGKEDKLRRKFLLDQIYLQKH